MNGLADHLQALFARLKIDCVLDVGAHLGQFGRLVRGLGYEGRIVSFEPVIAVFAALTKTCCSRDPRWEAHRLALGNSDGTATIKVAHSTDFSSLLEPSAESLRVFDGHTAVVRRERVPLRRLDSVVSDYLPEGGARAIFLKLDTQGSDLDVLRGAEDTLPRLAGIQVELPLKPLYEGMPRYHEVAAHLDERGFRPTGFFPVPTDREADPFEVDCVLVREERDAV